MKENKMLEDMSVDEIADEMGTSIGVALFRGRFQNEIYRWALIICQTLSEQRQLVAARLERERKAKLRRGKR